MIPKVTEILTTLFNSQHGDVLFEMYQNDFSCCGLYDSSDWLMVNKSIPSTCCSDSDEEDCAEKEGALIHDMGCIEKIGDIMRYFFHTLLWCGAIEIIGSVVSLSFALFVECTN
ncbi:hypothetical protein DMENIID0001_043780 [Sergentomyia squamirostris]